MKLKDIVSGAFRGMEKAGKSVSDTLTRTANNWWTMRTDPQMQSPYDDEVSPLIKRTIGQGVIFGAAAVGTAILADKLTRSTPGFWATWMGATLPFAAMQLHYFNRWAEQMQAQGSYFNIRMMQEAQKAQAGNYPYPNSGNPNNNFFAQPQEQNNNFAYTIAGVAALLVACGVLHSAATKKPVKRQTAPGQYGPGQPGINPGNYLYQGQLPPIPGGHLQLDPNTCAIIRAIGTDTQPIGSTVSGSIQKGYRMPASTPYIFATRWNKNKTWATTELATDFEIAACWVQKKYPGLKMSFGDVSKQGGGDDRPSHATHRNGTSIDVGLIFRNNGRVYAQGKPACKDTESPTPVNPDFDLAANWEFVKSVAMTPHAGRIILNRNLIRTLEQYANQHEPGAFRVIKGKAYVYGLPLVHVRNHNNHYHIDYICGDDDAQCINRSGMRLKAPILLPAFSAGIPAPSQMGQTHTQSAQPSTGNAGPSSLPASQGLIQPNYGQPSGTSSSIPPAECKKRGRTSKGSYDPRREDISLSCIRPHEFYAEITDCVQSASFAYPVDPDSFIIERFGDKTQGPKGEPLLSKGILIETPEGTEIKAIADGTVYTMRRNGITYARIDHDGIRNGNNHLFSEYFHINPKKFVVRNGQRVKKGQTIGLSGRTPDGKTAIFHQAYFGHPGSKIIESKKYANPLPLRYRDSPEQMRRWSPNDMRRIFNPRNRMGYRGCSRR